MQKDQHSLTEQEIQYWMTFALEEAEKGAKADQIPSEGKYQKVAGSHNLTNVHKNASRHCQINCILEMENNLTKNQISQCILFVTVEPCIMCTFALNLINVKEVYFGQFNDKFGGCGSLRKDNKFKIRGGIMEKQSLALIKSFYERGNQKIPEEMRNKSRKKVKQNQE